MVWRTAPTWVVTCQLYSRGPLASASVNRGGTVTHNDENHRNPHRKPPPRLLADSKSENTAGKGSEVVYRDDDALEGGIRMAKRVEPIFVAHDSRKDALVIPKEHESLPKELAFSALPRIQKFTHQLTSDGDCNPQPQTAAEKSIRSDHLVSFFPQAKISQLVCKPKRRDYCDLQKDQKNTAMVHAIYCIVPVSPY